MRSTLKRILPLLAVAGALTVAVCQLLGSSHREGFLTDTGWTRPSVEAALAKLQGMHPAGAGAPRRDGVGLGAGRADPVRRRQHRAQHRTLLHRGGSGDERHPWRTGRAARGGTE